MDHCSLSAAGFKALVEAAWPSLTSFSANIPTYGFGGLPLVLGAAAFAAFPALEELCLNGVPLGEAGAVLLASRRWVRLKRLDLFHTWLDAGGFAALARGEWPALQELDLYGNDFSGAAAGPALAALSRHARLRRLNVADCRLSAAGFKALVEATWPALTRLNAGRFATTGAAAKVEFDGPHALGVAAFAGFPALEELNLKWVKIGEAGAALLASQRWPRLRKLELCKTQLGAAGLAALARGAWPALEELDLRANDFDDAAAGPALAALSQHVGLRRLDVIHCSLSAAGFKALVEAHWPALTSLGAVGATVAFDGPHALGAAAFAGFPALEELDLSCVNLGEAGAALLASRRWPRLTELKLYEAELGDAGVAALARGAWPALELLDLRGNYLGVPPALEEARRWAPLLGSLYTLGE